MRYSIVSDKVRALAQQLLNDNVLLVPDVSLDLGQSAGMAAPGNLLPHVYPAGTTAASVVAAVAGIGATRKTLHLLPEARTHEATGADVVIPENVLTVIEHGTMITKTGSKKLIFNGPVDAPPTQWLSGFAAGDVEFNHPSTTVDPAWFGSTDP